MAFLDLGSALHAGIEFVQNLFMRVGEFDYGEGNMIEAELRRIDNRREDGVTGSIVSPRP